MPFRDKSVLIWGNDFAHKRYKAINNNIRDKFTVDITQTYRSSNEKRIIVLRDKNDSTLV